MCAANLTLPTPQKHHTYSEAASCCEAALLSAEAEHLVKMEGRQDAANTARRKLIHDFKHKKTL